MSLIESLTPQSFFANFIVPLKRLNARRRLHYFAAGPDLSRESYWEPIATRTGGFARLPAISGGASSLLDLLASYWEASGDEILIKLIPQLKVLQKALVEESPPSDDHQAKVSDFIYPLY